MSDTSQIDSHIQVYIVPVAEEDDDLETLSLVGDARRDFLAEISQFDLFIVEQTKDYTRSGAGFITLAINLARKIYTQRERIARLFQASAKTVEVLAKQQRVGPITMIIDGDPFSIANPSDALAERLVSIYEANHPGKAQQITSSTKIEIIGSVSKNEPPAITERSVSDKDN